MSTCAGNRNLMLRWLLLSFAATVLIGCTREHDGLSVTLVTTKTPSHKRIAGTRIFVVVPSGYEHHRELVRYQKRDDLYFMAIEVSGTSFTDYRPNLTKEAIEAKGARVDEWAEISLNGEKALYVAGPSKIPGQTKLGLFFGDDSTYVMFFGVCDDEDRDGRQELLDAIRSTYFDHAFELDPFELANCTFDASILNYQFAMSGSNMFLYSPNGDVDTSATTSGMVIQTMPGMTPAGLRSYAETLLRKSQRDAEFDESNIRDTTIGTYNAAVLEATIRIRGDDGAFYQVVVSDGNQTAILICTEFREPAGALVDFRKVAESIRFK